MNIDRRSLLKYAALAPFVSAVAPIGRTAQEGANAKADYTLRIGTGRVELSPEHIASTTLYNGQFPGPLLRFKEGLCSPLGLAHSAVARCHHKRARGHHSGAGQDMKK